MKSTRRPREWREFRDSIGQISDNEAAGLIAGIEAPALDISAILHEIIGRAGFPELLDTDFLRLMRKNRAWRSQCVRFMVS